MLVTSRGCDFYGGFGSAQLLSTCDETPTRHRSAEMTNERINEVRMRDGRSKKGGHSSKHCFKFDLKFKQFERFERLSA